MYLLAHFTGTWKVVNGDVECICALSRTAACPHAASLRLIRHASAGQAHGQQVVEVAEGIPAPFPLIAHQPSPAPVARPAQRPPRQHSRANRPAQNTFAACLLSNQPSAAEDSQTQQAMGSSQAQQATQSHRHSLEVPGGFGPDPAQQEQNQPAISQDAPTLGLADSQRGVGQQQHLQRFAQQEAPMAAAGLCLDSDNVEHQMLAPGLPQESVAEADNQGSTLEDDYQEAQHQEPMDPDALLHPPVIKATNPSHNCLQLPGVFLSGAPVQETAPQHRPSAEQQQQGEPGLVVPEQQHHDQRGLPVPDQQCEQLHPAQSDQQQQQPALPGHQERQPRQIPHVDDADQAADQQLSTQGSLQAVHAQHGRSFGAEHSAVPAVQLLSQQLVSSAPLSATATPHPAPAAQHPPQSPLALAHSPQNLAVQQVLQALGSADLMPAHLSGHQSVRVSEAPANLSQLNNESQPGQSLTRVPAYGSSPETHVPTPNSQQQRQQQQPQQQQQESHLGSCQSPVMLQFGAQRLSTFASPEADVNNQSHHVVDDLSPAQPAEEDYEQDVMSQPDSSEDEDFSPSEFEQDEMSQPESSSSEEDAFEMDEMSQPESSSEDEPARERAPPSRPSSAGQRAESKSKSSRLRPVSERQLARLGFPKAAQPASDGVTRSGRLSPASAKKIGLRTSGRKRSSKHALLDDNESPPEQTKSKRGRTSLACADLHPDNDKASHDRQQRRVREQPGQRHASNAAQQVSNCLSQLCCFSCLFVSYT